MDESVGRKPTLTRYGAAVGAVAVLVGLYAASRYNYLLFHSIAEVFSIVVACTMFAFCWNSRRFLEDNYLVLLGIAYLCVGGLDMLHTLAFKDMNIFHVPGSNLATQLWVAARYVESLSLLGAGLLVGRRIRPAWACVGYGVVFTALTLTILVWPIFPVCYIEGPGLTAFKVGSEYVICGILLAALASMIRKRGAIGPKVFGLLAASVAITVVSELFFTLYVDVYGFFNLLGHYLKIVSFYLIYKAVIQTGLVEPFGLLFRSLKESERTLGNERALFQSVLQQMPDGVVILGAPSGQVILANDQAERVWGREFLHADDLLASTGLKAFHADGSPYRPSDWAPIRALRSSDVVGRQEVLVQGADGSFDTILVSAAPVYDPHGAIIATVSTSSDITPRKRMEEALRRSREDLERRVADRTADLAQANQALAAYARQWQTTFDSIIDAVALLDMEGRIVKCNRALAALADRPIEDLTGRVCHELLQCPWTRSLQCPVTRMHRSRRREQGLRPIAARWFRVSADPLLNDTGAIIGAVHILRDVTEQKHAEEQIQAYQDDLRMLASELSLTEERERRRIATALHDHIGQSLALAQMKLGALKQSAQGEPMADAVDQVREMVRRSIDYTRSLVFELSPPVLYEVGLAAALERLMQNVEREHGLAFEFEDDGRPKPLGDDMRVVLFQSGRELLMNVVKHAKATRVRVSVTRQDEEVHVTLSDDGAGFDPAETSRAHREGGFGLFSIRERLDRVGGHLELWSRPGRGTVATLVAPVGGTENGCKVERE